MIFKCKMCGGDITIIEGTSICECEYCGSKQTLPNFDNEKKTKLFERASRLRFECEFDKAATIYESIVSEFPEEAEAYWGLVLCKYGIEYVDDPKTGDKIPTCHRLSFGGVTDDTNYDNALLYGDKESKDIYIAEASKIEEIRKKVVAVSSKEQPYDVFICYKETDANGERTEDSVLAQKIYEELTLKDYRVFFSKITLESKLGEEYEPYIFAALNSAKVMLVVGTDYNNINSIWVRNEWSRYLDLMKRNKDKMLIPCYKDMDPYDFPKEMSGLQAQDMGKVGAIQDLVRGIGKVIPKGSQQVGGLTEDTLKTALKKEAKRRTIKTLIIGSFILIVAACAIFAGVNTLIQMIKENKNTTIINNESSVSESATESTTESKSEWKGEFKMILIDTGRDDGWWEYDCINKVLRTDYSSNKKDQEEMDEKVSQPAGGNHIEIKYQIISGPESKILLKSRFVCPDGSTIDNIDDKEIGMRNYYQTGIENDAGLQTGDYIIEIYNGKNDELIDRTKVTIY